MGTRAVSYKLEVHAVCSFAQCGLHFPYTSCAGPTGIVDVILNIRCCTLIKIGWWVYRFGKTMDLNRLLR